MNEEEESDASHASDASDASEFGGPPMPKEEESEDNDKELRELWNAPPGGGDRTRIRVNGNGLLTTTIIAFSSIFALLLVTVGILLAVHYHVVDIGTGWLSWLQRPERGYFGELILDKGGLYGTSTESRPSAVTNPHIVQNEGAVLSLNPNGDFVDGVIVQKLHVPMQITRSFVIPAQVKASAEEYVIKHTALLPGQGMYYFSRAMVQLVKGDVLLQLQEMKLVFLSPTGKAYHNLSTGTISPQKGADGLIELTPGLIHSPQYPANRVRFELKRDDIVSATVDQEYLITLVIEGVGMTEILN